MIDKMTAVLVPNTPTPPRFTTRDAETVARMVRWAENDGADVLAAELRSIATRIAQYVALQEVS